MEYNNYLKGISFGQLLSYFSFEEEYRTSFYVYYSSDKSDLSFILYNNIDADNAVSCFDVYNIRAINKLDLYLLLNVSFDFDSIDNIIAIDKTELNIQEPATEDEVIKGFFRFEEISKENKNIAEYANNEFLFSSYLLRVYQNSDDDILFPLFDKDGNIVNYYKVSDNIELMFPHKSGGVYISNNSVDALLLTCNPICMFTYFQDNIYTDYLSLLFNCNVDFGNACTIYKVIEQAATSTFLYCDIPSAISALSLFCYVVNITTEYEITFNYSGVYLTLDIIAPKGVSNLTLITFFQTLNNNIYKLLNIKKEEKDDAAKIEVIKSHSFDSASLVINKKHINHLVFIPNLTLMSVLFEDLNTLVFGADSQYSFVYTKNTGVEEEEEEDDFGSLFK